MKFIALSVFAVVLPVLIIIDNGHFVEACKYLNSFDLQFCGLLIFRGKALL